jgi:glyoxylase-like metal-dependent hydrolase (beta-lactamase superfamily II)
VPGDEPVLVETGSQSSVPVVLDALSALGVGPDDLAGIVVTHIHLDHAGAAGPLARDNPDLQVFVHPFGAPHLIDPAKLISSASRIYGDQMEPLWGEFAAIAVQQVHALVDGQVIEVAGRRIEAVFTPGHAHHHIAYGDLAEHFAFTGDVGGVRMQGTDYVCPPTPPPDLDPELWHESIARLQGFDLERLYLTHFGEFRDVDRHLGDLGPNLDEFLQIGADALDAGLEPEELTRRLHARMERGLGEVHPGVMVNLEWATPSYMATLGLIRWRRKLREQGS